MKKYRYHIWPQASLPESHRSEIAHFYTPPKGTPTSTASTRTTKAPKEQSSLARRDTTIWLTAMGRSQGSITDTLFGPSIIPTGELSYLNHDRYNTFAVITPILIDKWWKYRSEARYYIHGSAGSHANCIDFIKIESSIVSIRQHHDLWLCAAISNMITSDFFKWSCAAISNMITSDSIIEKW
jgi:hypothetical protein